MYGACRQRARFEVCFYPQHRCHILIKLSCQGFMWIIRIFLCGYVFREQEGKKFRVLAPAALLLNCSLLYDGEKLSAPSPTRMRKCKCILVILYKHYTHIHTSRHHMRVYISRKCEYELLNLVYIFFIACEKFILSKLMHQFI